jgi:hypothetical protein
MSGKGRILNSSDLTTLVKLTADSSPADRSPLDRSPLIARR